MRFSTSTARKVTYALAMATVIAGLGASAASASEQGVRWKQMLLTPLQAQALQQGSGFHYYDRPAKRSGYWRVGDDRLCAKGQMSAGESILGDLPATEHPEDLWIEVDAFATAAAAHRTFRCLSRETFNFTHGGDFDLRDLQPHVGDESFGGGGDNNPIGALRSGRYIVWIEITDGYGPIGDLMQGEVSLVRQYG